MGQKHSKDLLLYQHVIHGDVEAIRALYTKGASLEWKDKQGRTPLIVAAKDPRLYFVAKTLIELGANVNAISREHHGGTPLHYAAKEGLDRTVKLLLSHGANALVKNKEHQTPLDVARKNARDVVVREIEGSICYFAGEIREMFGPGFSDLSAPQFSSRVIWVVVVPRSPHTPPKAPKLELVIYSSPQDAEPRKIVSLSGSKVKEPKFDQPTPALIIFDKHTKIRYKFTSVNVGDKQQLRRLYNACKGISQVMPASAQMDPEALTTPALKTIAEAVMAIAANSNTWMTSPGRLSPSIMPINNNNSLWVSESPRPQYNNHGWPTPTQTPNHQSPRVTTSVLQTPDRLFPAVLPSAPPVNPPGNDHFTPNEDESRDSSSCVVCWEAPVEGACVPCGHVSTCMSCLKEIKDNNGVCPVCRSNIDQILKLYGI